jgi:hypothetical protein
MWRRSGTAMDPHISIEDFSTSSSNGGVLYVGDSEITYLQASDSFVLIRNTEV